MSANPQTIALDARPPFRADHVGSFLRPGYLLLAREAAQRGELTAAQLREVEDRAIREVVTLQQDVGAWEGALNCRVWSSCSSGRQLELCLHSDGHDLEPGFLHAGLEWALALAR